MNQPDEEHNEEYDFLVTRASFHQKNDEELPSEKVTPSRKTKYLTKYISCHTHNSASKSCEKCLVLPIQTQLPNGKLPTGEQILGYLYYQNEQMRISGNLGHSSIRNVAGDLLNHWIDCNVYTKTLKVVSEKLKNLDDQFKTLKRYPAKKKGETFRKKLSDFKLECKGIFDIRTEDTIRQRHQGKFYDVHETETEKEFYKDQPKVPQIFFLWESFLFLFVFL